MPSRLDPDGGPTPAPAAVLFDLDGVLVDSAPLHHEAFRRTFAGAGVPFTWNDYLERGIGVPREVVIRRVLGDELPAPELHRLMAAKEEHVRTVIAERGLEPIPGARAFVLEARRRGLPVAVATASRTPGLLLRGAGLEGLFDAVVDRTAVRRSKPAPDVWLAAARELGVDPTACLALEDSPPGVESALRAGLRAIALATSEPPGRLARAHAVVRGFHEIDRDRWLGPSPSRRPAPDAGPAGEGAGL